MTFAHEETSVYFILRKNTAFPMKLHRGSLSPLRGKAWTTHAEMNSASHTALQCDVNSAPDAS